MVSGIFFKIKEKIRIKRRGKYIIPRILLLRVEKSCLSLMNFELRGMDTTFKKLLLLFLTIAYKMLNISRNSKNSEISEKLFHLRELISNWFPFFTIL